MSAAKAVAAIRILVLATLALLVAPRAQAAPRTICFRVQITDTRSGCPTSTTVGVKRPCNASGSSDFIGGVVELWDWDDNAIDADDFIGAYVITNSGQTCATFEWETAGYAHDPQGWETHPDVFLRVRYEAYSTSVVGPLVRATDDNQNVLPVVSFRSTSVINNCTGTCSFPNTLLTGGSATSDLANRFMAVDEAQRVLEIYSGAMESAVIRIRYPGSTCPSGGGSSSTDRNVICAAQWEPLVRAQSTSHEMGHVLQKHLFHQDDLRSVYVGTEWKFDTAETDSAATTEGWATYVGAVAWYDPQNTSATFAPKYDTLFIENATPIADVIPCSNSNRKLPGQAAKAFWDYDDASNEGPGGAAGASDVKSQQTLWMATRWDLFADGTANHQDYESDADGVNVYDYWFNAASGDFSAYDTMLTHNCLTAQDTF